jgi:hypothetical protein
MHRVGDEAEVKAGVEQAEGRGGQRVSHYLWSRTETSDSVIAPHTRGAARLTQCRSATAGLGPGHGLRRPEAAA